jgi:hypothetical protein
MKWLTGFISWRQTMRIRKLFYILTWIPVIVIKLVLVLAGLLVVPLAIMTGWPKLFWLWNNAEEGCPDWWHNVAKDKGGFIARFPQFWWFAIRNPVNNMRFVFKDREANIRGNWAGERMEAQDLLDVGRRKAYRWSYNGMFASYRRVWLHDFHSSESEFGLPKAQQIVYGAKAYSEFWIGWKVGSSVPGMGFAMQYRRKREIGT